MTPKGLKVDGVRYLNSDGRVMPGDISIMDKSGKWIPARYDKDVKEIIKFYDENKVEIPHTVDQPEWCSEDIKVVRNPVFWMIATAVVAGLALFLVHIC